MQWFDPELTLWFQERLYAITQEERWELSNPVRLTYQRSQLTVEVSAAAGAVEFIHNLAIDPVTGASGPFVLTEEPQLQEGQGLNADQAIAIIGGWMGFKSNRAAAAALAEVNIIYDALSDAQLRGKLSNRTVIGPIQWEPHLSGGPLARNSVDAAGTGDVLGGSENQFQPFFLPNPQVLEPNQQLSFRSLLPGDFINANITNDFLINLNLVFLTADKK